MADRHAQAARRAAELIEANGWWTRDFFPDPLWPGYELLEMCGKPVCAAGALALATCPEDDPHDRSNPYVLRVWEVFADWIYPPVTDMDRHVEALTRLSWWNDDPARTGQQVVSALRGFADQLEAA